MPFLSLMDLYTLTCDQAFFFRRRAKEKQRAETRRSVGQSGFSQARKKYSKPADSRVTIPSRSSKKRTPDRRLLYFGIMTTEKIAACDTIRGESSPIFDHPKCSGPLCRDCYLIMASHRSQYIVKQICEYSSKLVPFRHLINHHQLIKNKIATSNL